MRKGRQLGILTAGTYRINLALFTVITSASAMEHGMTGVQLHLHRVEPDMVGIVTTLDGRPIEAGEIAGPVIAGHDNFQNAQAFLDGGGRRGLQEQILLSGTWNLNPWFVAGGTGADGANPHRLRRRGDLVRRPGARGRQRARIQARRPRGIRAQGCLGDARCIRANIRSIPA